MHYKKLTQPIHKLGSELVHSSGILSKHCTVNNSPMGLLEFFSDFMYNNACLQFQCVAMRPLSNLIMMQIISRLHILRAKIWEMSHNGNVYLGLIGGFTGIT